MDDRQKGVVGQGEPTPSNRRYRPALRPMYAPVAFHETYGGATECTFGQQRDEKKAWVPNYDLFFFEVQTRSGIKMLHEMRGRDGKYDRVDPYPSTLQDRWFDPRFSTDLLPLYWPEQVVDALALRLG